jgi:cytochrome c oxidase subunit III
MPRSTNTAIADELPAGKPAPPLRVVQPREGGPRRPPTGSRPSNARVAVAMLLVAETMFFAGLIGAYLVFRVGSVVWPPPGLPALPLGVTWLNTVFLFVSGVTMVRSVRGIRRGDVRALQRGLLWTASLGGVFVAVQGWEWVRLVGHGLQLSSGPYGGTFYTLIGTHAAHVLGAIAWVFFVLAMARRDKYTAKSHDAVEACAIYWLYVCALWGVLFGLVYH